MRWEDSGKLLLAFVLVVGTVVIASLVSVIPTARVSTDSATRGPQSVNNGWMIPTFAAPMTASTQVGPETGGRGRSLPDPFAAPGTDPGVRGIVGHQPTQLAEAAPAEPPVYLIPSQVLLPSDRVAAIAAREADSYGPAPKPSLPAAAKPLGTGGGLYVTSVSATGAGAGTSQVHGLLAGSRHVWPYQLTLYNSSDQPSWVMPHSVVFSDGSAQNAFLCTSDWSYSAGAPGQQGGYTPTLANSPCAEIPPHTTATLYVYAEDGGAPTTTTRLANNRPLSPQSIRLISLPDGSIANRLPEGVIGADRAVRIADILHGYSATDGKSPLLQVSI
jgi:hypothetical protein